MHGTPVKISKDNSILMRTYSLSIERELYPWMQTLLSPHSFPEDFLNINSTDIIYSLACEDTHTRIHILVNQHSITSVAMQSDHIVHKCNETVMDNHCFRTIKNLLWTSSSPTEKSQETWINASYTKDEKASSRKIITVEYLLHPFISRMGWNGCRLV